MNDRPLSWAAQAGPPARSAVEAAVAEYLGWRVQTLAAIAGNPHGAALRAEGGLRAFLVRDNPSPMFNRICGEMAGEPDAFKALLEWFARHRCCAAGRSPTMRRAGRRTCWRAASGCCACQAGPICSLGGDSAAVRAPGAAEGGAARRRKLR